MIIPQTDLDATPICLGTGGFGSNVPDALGVIDTYYELGGRFIDTANNYGDWIEGNHPGASERLIGAWATSRGVRDQILLATKGGHPKFDAPHRGRLSREDIFTDLEQSLERLRIDRIDLYWLHKDEPTRPIEEIVETLDELVRLGRVRYLGASNFSVDRICSANDYARSRGLSGFIADQVLWNAAPLAGYPYGDPGIGFMNRDRWDFHQETGMAMMPFQSLAWGLFHRMHTGTLDAMNPGFRGFYVPGESEIRFARIREVMADTGLSVSQVVLGYLLGQPFPTFPIIGSNRPAQVRDAMTALNVRLTPEQIDHIDGGEKGSELPRSQN
jgi:aryl-alcohol dehydrogenase-like predicted oxidoreductase